MEHRVFKGPWTVCVTTPEHILTHHTDRRDWGVLHSELLGGALTQMLTRIGRDFAYQTHSSAGSPTISGNSKGLVLPSMPNMPGHLHYQRQTHLEASTT